MKIIIYSDLHLEFGTEFQPPADSKADLMVLAGDIIGFRDFRPFEQLLDGWNKPVLYVTGNHEYYTQKPMDAGERAFRAWLEDHCPNVVMLQDEAVTIDGVQFFGGTMWTNFAGLNLEAMTVAKQQMNDFRLIVSPSGELLKPEDTVSFHEQFARKLLEWFESDLDGPRIVITHHAPVVNPDTQYENSPLMPAFNSLDMKEIIEKHQPNLWIYGHTHECDDQTIGETRIISNQLGYPNRGGGFECAGFDEGGKLVEV